MIRLSPAFFAILGSTFAASAAFAAGQDAPPASQPAAHVQAAEGELSCRAIRQQMAARTPEQPSRGRQLFGFAAAALQAAGPSFGGYGGSTAGSVLGAVAQQGAIQAMNAGAASAAAGSATEQRKRLAALAEEKGC